MKRIIAVLIPLMFPLLALAATCPDGSTAGLCNPLGFKTLTDFLARILTLVTYIMFPIITLFMVYTGFLFVSSGGDPKKLQKAREYFFWAVVGALIVLGASALSYAIQGTVDELQQGI